MNPLDTRCFWFIDKTRATLDEPEGWTNVWVYFGDERHQRLRCQHRGGGVMLWTGIIWDRLIGSIRVSEGVKVTAAANYNLLNDVLLSWLHDIPLSLLMTQIHAWQRSLTLCQGYPSIPRLLQHTRWKVVGVVASLSRYQTCRKSLLHYKTKCLCRWTSIHIKRKILWVTIQAVSDSVQPATIKKLTDSMTNRVFEVEMVVMWPNYSLSL